MRIRQKEIRRARHRREQRDKIANKGQAITGPTAAAARPVARAGAGRSTAGGGSGERRSAPARRPGGGGGAPAAQNEG